MDYYYYNQWKLACFHVPWWNTSYEAGKMHLSQMGTGVVGARSFLFTNFPP